MGALGDGHFSGELDNCNDLRCLDEEVGPIIGSDEPESEDPIEDAVRVLLRGLGEDCDREGLRRTPKRVAKAFRDGTRGYRQKVNEIVQGALFPEAGLNNGKGLAGGVGGLVVVRDINLFSYCESCLLPFRVDCHVGYVPAGKRVVGLSKLSRVADVFAKRLQSPQLLADDVCSALHQSIRPAGVVVALQCWHINLPEELLDSKCTLKMDTQGWLQFSVCSGSGVFQNCEGDFWEDFCALLKLRGVNMARKTLQHPSVPPWCPLTFDMTSCNGHGPKHLSNGGTASDLILHKPSMIAAATSIICALGEDNPSRKELIFTPYRFVQWMMRFKRCSLNLNLNGFNHINSMDLEANGYIQDSRKVVHAELNLPFCAQCEHHLLPFYGMVHIGYFHSGFEGIERSKLQSLVHYYGCKLQVQERLTREIAEIVFQIFTEGVMVVVEAYHTCMISRGIEKVGSNTATVAVLGRFSSDPAAKAEFLQNICNNSGKVT